MWLGLALVVAGASLLAADKNSGKQKIQPQPVSLLDLLQKVKKNHPSHFMVNGVDDDFRQEISDLHGGHGESEAQMQIEDIREFLENHSARKKKRQHNVRQSGDRRSRGQKRSRNRRSVTHRPITRRTREAMDIRVSAGNVRHKRFFGTWMLWEKGRVPFKFADNCPTEERNAAFEAMAEIEKWTCIRFHQWDGTDDFNSRLGLDHNTVLTFVPNGGSGCWSKIGRKNVPEQEISPCAHKVKAMHELGHALGAFHEHESYSVVGNVEEHLHNVKEGMQFNFKHHDPAYRSFYNVEPYDLQSLMHYGPFDFSANGLATLDPLYEDFAQPADDHWLLLKEMSKVYKCWDLACPNITEPTCNHQGYAGYHNSTCGCVCPAGLDPDQNCNNVRPGDCGGIYTLSRDNSTQEVKSPNYPMSVMPQETCTWIFVSPGKIKMDVMNMHAAGDSDVCRAVLQIRRNLLGQSGTIYCGQGFEKGVFSLGNNLAVTLKSQLTGDAVFFGKATALFAEDSCYNWNDRGETYNGDVNMSQGYRPCVNWTEATHCEHHPFSMSGELKADYSGNACRNPGGVLHSPWCYVAVTHTYCTIRYCDPCQLDNVHDIYDNCMEMVEMEHPDLCHKEEGIQNCRLTCGLHNIPVTMAAKCGTPDAIAGASVTSATKAMYDIGDMVTYQCDSNTSLTANRHCLSKGQWSDLRTVCNVCVDKKSTCLEMLMSKPNLCTAQSAFVEEYCRGSCNLCGDSGATCLLPTLAASSNAVLKTSSSSLGVGQHASYECAEDFFHKTGDLHHVCLPGGVLHGELPFCATMSSDVTRVSDLEVGQLPAEFGKGWMIYGANDYTVIHRSGAVRTWYVYCVDPGFVSLVVFRKTLLGYEVIGLNEVYCERDRVQVEHVPLISQIHVEPGDFIGALDLNGGVLTYTFCSNTTVANQMAIVSGWELVVGTVLGEFASSMCLYPALNADIGPILKGSFVVHKYTFQLNQ